ncbi:DUF7657 domain-containing protein [Methanobrevibacter wolinii]
MGEFFINFNYNSKELSLTIILSLVFSFLLEFYIILLENPSKHNFLNLFSIKHFIIFLILFLIVFLIYFNKNLKSKTLSFLYRYRYPIAFVVFLICVLFEVNGSSFGLWDNFLGSSHNSVLGVGRHIRSDEWNVLTSLSFSQYYNNFGYFSNIPTASLTDMFAVYGSPVLSILLIFRPFQIGYLFLSPGRALSFYWIGRLIALLLVSFEFGRFITKDDKRLATAYSILISFSPIVQWWFSVNYLVEILIFGQLICLCVYHYIKTDVYKKRLICALGFIISAGGYIFSLYPAWQIPFGYVFLFVLIWIIWDNYKDFNYSKLDIPIIIISFLIPIFSLVYFISLSANTIPLIMNSVYPGRRLYCGGHGNLHNFFNYIITIIFPLRTGKNPGIFTFFYDFFPLPIILYFIVNFIDNKKDRLLNLLFILYLVLIFFNFLGFPVFLSKITLLSKTTNERVFLIISFLNLLILFRSLSLIDKNSVNNFINRIKNHNGILYFISLLISLIVCVLIQKGTVSQVNHLSVYLIFSCLILSLAIFSIFKSSEDKYKNLFLIMCILIGFLAGGLVNPIESGVDYYNQAPIKEVQSIVASNPNANWIILGDNSPESPPIGNIFIPAGAHTINSINTYPHLETWGKLDSSHKYIKVYNRYAYINVILTNNDTKFKLKPKHGKNYKTVNNSNNNYRNDIFDVYLNVNDLEKLNVSYIESSKDLGKFNNTNVSFTKIYSVNNNKLEIYKVNYNS